MKKFEYLIFQEKVPLDSNLIIDNLTSNGKEGWELVHVLYFPGSCREFYFKREFIPK